VLFDEHEQLSRVLLALARPIEHTIEDRLYFVADILPAIPYRTKKLDKGIK
jgi:hypothetical protein